MEAKNTGWPYSYLIRRLRSQASGSHAIANLVRNPLQNLHSRAAPAGQKAPWQTPACLIRRSLGPLATRTPAQGRARATGIDLAPWTPLIPLPAAAVSDSLLPPFSRPSCLGFSIGDGSSSGLVFVSVGHLRARGRRSPAPAIFHSAARSAPNECFASSRVPASPSLGTRPSSLLAPLPLLVLECVQELDGG